tara:strand:+ start:2003 stop:2329 length:327 start_codon:yes stop_codon:yes gene_type:complete
MFGSIFDKAKNFFGNVYDVGKRAYKAVKFGGQLGYNLGRLGYDYLSGTDIKPANYFWASDTRQTIPNPIRAPPPRPPPNVLPKMPPISRQNDKKPEDLGNPYEFWTRN